MKRILLICFFMMTSTISTHANENTLLSYQSFIDYINAGQVQYVTIGDFDMKDIKVKIIKDGEEVIYLVERPYQAGDDPLLIGILKKKAIPFEILENDHISSGSMWKNMLPALLMFALPALFIIVLLIIGFVILSKVSHIERILENEKSRNIEH